VDDQRFVAEQLVMTGWVGPWAAAWSHLGTAGDWLYSRPSYAFRLAVALRTRGELAEASEILRRIQGRVPEGWRLYELGRIAEDEGDVRRAAAWYRKSAREPAGPPEASRRLGAGGRAGPGEFDLAGAVRFEAWSFHPAVVAPQEPLRVILRLKALEFLPEDYRIFVHFEESLHPRSRFQADHDPQGGRRPTTTWLPGETVTDTALVVVPPGVAPGKYRVVAGLFVPMGDKPRLGSAGQQKIELGWITVREPSATTAPPSHRPNGGVSSAGPS
jgi:hypothetical protein